MENVCIVRESIVNMTQNYGEEPVVKKILKNSINIEYITICYSEYKTINK